MVAFLPKEGRQVVLQGLRECMYGSGIRKVVAYRALYQAYLQLSMLFNVPMQPKDISGEPRQF